MQAWLNLMVMTQVGGQGGDGRGCRMVGAGDGMTGMRMTVVGDRMGLIRA